MHEHHQQRGPRCVYLLADSLDSILAACEDLLTERFDEPGHLLRLELAAITHVLQAHRYIEELEVSEPLLVDQFVLFVAGTAALDSKHLRRARSLQSQANARTGVLTDDYLIGGQLPLGFLAQLASTVLNALEAHFVLYEDEQVDQFADPGVSEKRPTA